MMMEGQIQNPISTKRANSASTVDPNTTRRALSDRQIRSGVMRYLRQIMLPSPFHPRARVSRGRAASTVIRGCPGGGKCAREGAHSQSPSHSGLSLSFFTGEYSRHPLSRVRAK